MALFRRRSARDTHPPHASAITTFWAWWRDGAAGRFAAAIDDGGLDGELIAEVSARVGAIDDGLDWEFAPGTRARHALCVTSGGVAELRATAERWRRAAPPEDTVWEYAAARRADPGATHQVLELDGHTLDLGRARLRLEIDDDRWRVHVGVFHPVFPDIPSTARDQIAYLLLDWLLGEDEVERWVGAVSVLDTSPADGVPPTAVPDVVDAAAARLKEGWALLEGRSPDGERRVVTVRRPLRRIDHPLLDLHHAVTLSFAEARDDGLPDQRALDELRVLQDDLTTVIGPRGLLVAHETAAGRRTLHVYTDAEDQNGGDGIARWVAEQRRNGRDVAASAERDPAWHRVRRFA